MYSPRESKWWAGYEYKDISDLELCIFTFFQLGLCLK